jgi:hypothetical protein
VRSQALVWSSGSESGDKLAKRKGVHGLKGWLGGLPLHEQATQSEGQLHVAVFKRVIYHAIYHNSG